MMTSRFANGPGSVLLPGSGRISAFFANDNAAPRQQAVMPKGACGIVLARKEGVHTPFLSISALLDDGTSISLYGTNSSEMIVALWRGMGRDFNLPLLIEQSDGMMQNVTHAPGAISFSRRFGSPLSGRRPRFLTRRKPVLGPFETHKQRRQSV